MEIFPLRQQSLQKMSARGNTKFTAACLSLVHNMTLVRASRRERRERHERRFVNYPASVSVGER